VVFGHCSDAVEDLLTDRQDLALEGVLIGDLGAAGDDRLADPWHRLDDPSAEPSRVDRHIAPADEALSLGPDEMLDVLDRDGARVFIPRQKAHRNGIAAERRQQHALPVRPIAEQRIGHLDQAARAVTD